MTRAAKKEAREQARRDALNRQRLREAQLLIAEEEAAKHVHFRDDVSFCGTPGECSRFAGRFTTAGMREFTALHERLPQYADIRERCEALVVRQSADWAVVTCPKCHAHRRAFNISMIEDRKAAIESEIAALAHYEQALLESP